MRVEHLTQPAIPIVYGLLILDVAARQGIPRETLLQDASIPPALWQQADARLSIVQAGGLLYRALQLTKNAGFGYDIGLHSTVTSHGFMGYGVLSLPTLRHAIEFGAKFLPLRLPNLSIRIQDEGDWTALIVSETVPQGAVRQCMLDLFLVGLWRIGMAMNNYASDVMSDIELWFEQPEPDYYARYRDRLPTVRFSMPGNQMRVKTTLLDRLLPSQNSVTAQLVEQQCEKELSELGLVGDFVVHIRTQLADKTGRYLGLETLAARLHMSARTLKRKLQQHGTSFQSLLDERRRTDAIRLLQQTTLSIEEIAERTGYTDRANFTRAFRKWTGLPPSDYSERNRSAKPARKSRGR